MQRGTSDRTAKGAGRSYGERRTARRGACGGRREFGRQKGYSELPTRSPFTVHRSPLPVTRRWPFAARRAMLQVMVSPERLTKLFAEFHAPLVRFLTRRLGDQDWAEEVAQETFVRALKQDTIASERSWLFAVASNLVRDNQTRGEVGTRAPIDVVQAQSEQATRRQTPFGRGRRPEP